MATGVSHGLDLACRHLASPGDHILVEQPTYFLAGSILKQAGLKPVGSCWLNEKDVANPVHVPVDFCICHSLKVLHVPVMQCIPRVRNLPGHKGEATDRSGCGRTD